MSGDKPLIGPAYGLIEKGLRPLEVAFAGLAGLMMLAAMLLTAFDALLRYGFDAPLRFNYYLTENYLMVGMLVLPLAWGFREGGYIRVVALVQALPQSTRSPLLRVGLVVSSVYVAALAYFANNRFLEAWRRGSVEMGIIDWPISWSWIWVPLGLGLLSIRLLVLALGPADGLAGGTEGIPEDGA